MPDETDTVRLIFNSYLSGMGVTAIMKMLTEQNELPIDFSDDLWLAAVDHATVNANETVTFTFKDGMKITEQM